MGNVSGKVYGGVGGGAVAGAVTIILVWLVQVTTGKQVPNEVAQAITILLSAVGAFYAGYLAPHDVPSAEQHGVQPPEHGGM